jgi:Flp pilus assembly protein protease CpaA
MTIVFPESPLGVAQCAKNGGVTALKSVVQDFSWGIKVPIHVILYALISLWLIVIAVLDIRRGEVSNWLTIPPLLIATIWRSAHGGWAILILFVMVLFISEWPVAWPLGIAGVVAIWPQVVIQGMETTAAVWFITLVLWLINVLGGADVKVVMTLMVLFPDPRLAWLLLLSWLGLSLVYVIRQRGQFAPHRFLPIMREKTALSAFDPARYSPALPAVALAGSLYLCLCAHP